MLTERMILYMTEKEFMSGSELRQYLHISTRKMKYLMDNNYILHETRDTRPINTGCGQRMRCGSKHVWIPSRAFYRN